MFRMPPPMRKWIRMLLEGGKIDPGAAALK
jgi:hypothetical protein